MAFTFMEIPKREFLRLKIFRSMLSLRNILETLIESGMIGGIILLLSEKTVRIHSKSDRYTPAHYTKSTASLNST